MTWLPVLRRSQGTSVRSLRDEMDRLFTTFSEDWPENGLVRSVPCAWYPAVDIEENENEYLLRAELPGMEVDDVDISLTDNVLTIKGEKKLEKEEKEKNYHHVECRYGTFQRTFQLPPNVDANKVKAEFSKGVMTVHIPKSPETKPKKIEIKSA